MKKNSLLSVLITISIFSFGQSYFIIENLYVAPENPDTRDTITAILSGFLADSGSRIDTVYSYTEDFEIFIYLESSSTGGFQVTSDHDESVQLGSLVAGSYHINFLGNGTFINISDTTQYYFEVTPYAQIPEEDAKMPFVFYPNPCKEILFTRDQNSLLKSVDIYTLEGKIIQSYSNVSEIDLSIYTPGVYLVKGSTTENTFTEKIVKQ